MARGVAWHGCPKRLGTALSIWKLSTIVTVDMHAYFARASPANLAFLCDC